MFLDSFCLCLERIIASQNLSYIAQSYDYPLYRLTFHTYMYNRLTCSFELEDFSENVDAFYYFRSEIVSGTIASANRSIQK